MGRVAVTSGGGDCHRGPPRGHCWSSKGPSESLRSSKGTLLGVIVVLQGDVGGVVSLLGVAVGHRWSSKGTLLVLQRDIGVLLSLGCHRGPPRGHCWSSKGSAVSLWSSKGTLLVLQRDIGVVLSPLGVTVVLQRDIVGPPMRYWCHVVTAGCHCGPPKGHCRSSKGT